MENTTNEIISTLSIGDKIFAYRRRRGLSQEELAKKAGMSLSTIRGYERGRSVPSAERVGQIALALGVTPAMLQESDHLDPAPELIRGDGFESPEGFCQAWSQQPDSAFQMSIAVSSGGRKSYKVTCHDLPITDLIRNIIACGDGDALMAVNAAIDSAKTE